ncbi:GDSL-type esterase/lipase family protein [Cognataquiflexum rubidum]|uniref:GDSL-type esterase/lipase family protein n=1 Tax=Cognataquiflexum rubidum TaxID=2922273 RepID=UPI001F148C71|nr:GDSL-type esterase/lipase family protein [Cognataquiflexum rubidum]MCH6233204.1 GDSL-type esterase/lipase family protein [Cognataquiflexum rubidum]
MKNPFGTKILLLVFFFSYSSANIQAQENRFAGEVAALVVKYADIPTYRGGIVFTGSSSIRLWKTLEKDFPKSKIVNTGFGGSQTDDLLLYLDELVINFEPKKIFIYVGENDINAGKPVRQVLSEYAVLMERVSTKFPETEFYFIGTKPSPSRWEKRGQMMALNEEVRMLAQNKEKVTYIDVWTPMLDKSGSPNEELFVEDRLHMNAKGYKIWKKAVKEYLR